jgi:endonuclease/exonuclease/phosphatase family metal-dependent hydrolase
MIIATYNLWGFGEPWRYTAERGIARGAVPGSRAASERPREGVWVRRRRLLTGVLTQAAADVIVLQEVCIDPADGRSQAEQLAGDLGHHCAFLPFLEVDYGGTTYTSGLAVLSRFPLEELAPVPVPEPDGLRQHAAHTVVAAPAGPLDVLVLHLTPRSDSAQMAAVEQVHEYLDALPQDRPRVVAGDFNTGPESAAILAFSGGRVPLWDAWQEARPGDSGFTMPSECPVVRLDYLFLSPTLGVMEAAILGSAPDEDGFYPSDHRGLAVTVRDARTKGRT